MMHITQEENRRRAQLGWSAFKAHEDGKKLNGVAEDVVVELY